MKKIGILVIIVMILTIGSIVLKRPTDKRLRTESPQPTTQELEIFRSSDAMDFSVQISNNVKISEKFGRVTISNQGETIIIERNGTNFDNLKQYLSDLDSRHNPQVLEEKQLIIDGNEARMRLVRSLRESLESQYLIYVDNWVYTISTTSESLYDDLDQIAQSFRYTP